MPNMGLSYKLIHNKVVYILIVARNSHIPVLHGSKETAQNTELTSETKTSTTSKERKNQESIRDVIAAPEN